MYIDVHTKNTDIHVKKSVETCTQTHTRTYTYLNVSLAVEQEVLELEVAVNDALAVQICDGTGDLGAVEATSLLAKLAVALQVVEDLWVDE
jgi:hypothetical protein